MYIITHEPGGTLMGASPEMVEPVPVITVEQVPPEDGCALAMTLTASQGVSPSSSSSPDPGGSILKTRFPLRSTR